jgi:hypothetical protein
MKKIENKREKSFVLVKIKLLLPSAFFRFLLLLMLLLMKTPLATVKLENHFLRISLTFKPIFIMNAMK